MNIAKNMEIIFIAALALVSATSLASAAVPAHRTISPVALQTVSDSADDGRDDHRQAPERRAKSAAGQLIATLDHHHAENNMHKLIGAALMAITLSATTGAALAQQTSETRAVDARVLKVKLGGIIDLRLKQGPTASLVIAGDQRYVPKVVTTQQGDTLADRYRTQPPLPFRRQQQGTAARRTDAAEPERAGVAGRRLCRDQRLFRRADPPVAGWRRHRHAGQPLPQHRRQPRRRRQHDAQRRRQRTRRTEPARRRPHRSQRPEQVAARPAGRRRQPRGARTARRRGRPQHDRPGQRNACTRRPAPTCRSTASVRPPCTASRPTASRPRAAWAASAGNKHRAPIA